MPIANGPLEQRGGHSVVWTGSEMIVWGGQAGQDGHRRFADGAAYNPSTDQWHLISEGPLTPRAYQLATWTGREMLIIGGDSERDGAAYSPASDSWRPIPQSPIPVDGPIGGPIEGKIGTAWTGSEFVIWHVEANQMAAYDPAANQWRRLPTIAEVFRDEGALRWNGQHLYMLGASAGSYPSTNELSIARLDGDAWDPLPETSLSTDDLIVGARPQFTASDSARLLAWSDSGWDGRTMAFDPRADSWSEAPSVPIPSCEGQGEPLSASDRLFAFGWCGSNVGIFDSKTQTWTSAAIDGYPTARYAVWTGEELISWSDTCCEGPASSYAWSYRPPG
jgi:hypothetical protein